MSEGAKGVEEGPSGLERILKYLPSYSGYKEKEIRRETNKLVRIIGRSLIKVRNRENRHGRQSYNRGKGIR